jgi:integrase/recombinase XerD
LRFRVLVESILGSAMRISEVLSLNRSQIDSRTAETKIVGKGRKERTAFFTDRALYWIGEYLKCRTDDCPALFVCQDGKTRLKRTDVWRPFAKYRKLAGIEKRVTAHLLRHTAATRLLFNGCPIGHIKEILGHERLETTCRYYLGLDHRAAKAAHRKYLVYSAQEA